MSADDHTLFPGDGPKGVSLFLDDTAGFFRSELQVGGGDLVLPRFLAKLFALAFREAAARVDANEDTEAALRRELTIARAEVAQLEQKLLLAGVAIPARPGPACPRSRPVDTRRGEVVDIGDIARRLRRPPTDGGAA